jgi:hypothetical protein
MNMISLLPWIAVVPVAAYYWIPATWEGFRGQHPKGIIHLWYSGITTLGFISGASLVLRPSVADSARRHLEDALKGDVTSSYHVFLMIMIAAHFLVLSNLVRSYFNLHDIEKVKPGSHLARTIRSMESSGGAVRTEFALRLGMFALILMLNEIVVSLVWDDKLRFLYAFRFEYLTGFTMFWAGAVLFYFLLLSWDLVVWKQAKKVVANGGPPDVSVVDATATLKTLLNTAFPVHLSGFIASLCIALTFKFGTVLWSVAPAGVAAIVGVSAFLWGLRVDFRRVVDTLRGIG